MRYEIFLPYDPRIVKPTSFSPIPFFKGTRLGLDKDSCDILIAYIDYKLSL